MRLTVIVAALGLSACATTPSIESALAPLAGQPVQLVYNQLGEPTSVTQAGADTVYVWHRTSIVPGASLQSTTLGAPVAPSPDASGSGIYSGAAVPVECNVQVVADAAGRIKATDYIGGRGGCREPARKLSQLALADPQ